MSVFEGREWTIRTFFMYIKTGPFSKVENGRYTPVFMVEVQIGPVFQRKTGPGWTMKTCPFSKVENGRCPALDFQGFHVIFKGPGLGFSRISCHFQGARPWIFKDSASFSRAPALDFQGFHVIFKGPGSGFSRFPRYFKEPSAAPKRVLF